MIKNSIKNTGLFYTASPVKKLQQGGLTMGYGYTDPNKDMYRNIGDSSLYKAGVAKQSKVALTGDTAGSGAVDNRFKNRGHIKQTFDPNSITPQYKGVEQRPSQAVKNPPNLSMGNGLMYSKTGYNIDNGAAAPVAPDTAAAGAVTPVTDSTATTASTVAPTKGAGVAGVAGAVNSVAQPALALLDDKDPYTYTDKEKVGTAAASTVGTAVAGASLGASLGSLGVMVGTASALGTTVPVIGTVIGAVVGLGIGLWKMSKKKKEAKKNQDKRSQSVALKARNEQRSRLSKMDSNIIKSSGTMFGTQPGAQRTEGIPGGYLSIRR